MTSCMFRVFMPFDRFFLFIKKKLRYTWINLNGVGGGATQHFRSLLAFLPALNSQRLKRSAASEGIERLPGTTR